MKNTFRCRGCGTTRSSVTAYYRWDGQRRCASCYRSVQPVVMVAEAPNKKAPPSHRSVTQ